MSANRFQGQTRRLEPGPEPVWERRGKCERTKSSRLTMQLLRVSVFLSLTLVLAETKPWYEGDTCHRDQAGQEWKCRAVKACAQPPATDSEGPSCHSQALVCCPPSRPTRAAKDRISKLKCAEYAKFVFLEVSSQVEGEPPEPVDLCQFSEPLVVGGRNAEPKEYPHMALVGYGPANKKQWLCAGSLISERFVLSAAHCTSPDIVGEAKWIRLGEYDLSTDHDNKNGVADPKDFEIIERVNHPDYDPRDKYNDIALYKLDRDVEMGESIRAVCLHSAPEIPKPRVLASGWGNIKPGKTDSRSSILQKVYLDLVSDQQCKEAYQSVAGTKTKTGFVWLKDGIKKESMLCAGGKEGADTCLADSGGPVQYRLVEPYCMYSLVGVTSFGKTCGGSTPGVYTRVSHFLPWIESVVWP